VLTKLFRWGLPIAVTELGKRTHAQRGGRAESFHYGSSERVRINAPSFDDTAVVGGEYEISGPQLSVYENARLIGRSDPLGVMQTGQPIEGVARELKFDTYYQVRNAARDIGWVNTAGELLVPQCKRAASKTRLGTVVPFTRRKPHINYYHWLTEQLPRLRVVRYYVEETGEAPDILIEASPPSWILELLDFVGVPSDRRLEWTHEKATVDRLVVPNYVRKARPGQYEPSERDLRWVRENAKESVPEGQQNGHDRLFVNRRDADVRQLRNREAVVEMLHDYGFESITPGEYSVQEQVQMFRNADVVIGPHGAGLTNIMFGDDLTLVELFPNDYSPGYFYAITELLGFEHRYVYGTEADPHFRVSRDDLEGLLIEM
jgi:capsular polysaccharide biosynthesis protein